MDATKLNVECSRSSIEKKVESENNFHERLNFLIQEAGNPNAFANKTGISSSGVHRLIAGGYPTMQVMIAICSSFNISLDWLALGKSNPLESNEHIQMRNAYDNAGNIVNLEEFTFIPRYDIFTSVGDGCNVYEENFIFSMAYRTCWIKNYLKVNPKALIAITARGDSMLGVIDDRDVMIIDVDNKSLADGIFVLRLDGNLLVKRAQILPNSIARISSANSAYEPFEVDMKNPPNDFEVIGAVVHTEPETLFRYRKYSNVV